MSAVAARRYAGALSDLAHEQGVLADVARDVESFAALLVGAPELRVALTNPGFRAEELHGVVDAIADRNRYQQITRHFLKLLVDNHRLTVIDAIVDAFRVAADARLGRVRASLTSAAPLSPAALKGLDQKIRALTGAHEVVIETAVDPNLLGGTVTRIGDTVYDGSLRTRLDTLRNTLLGHAVAAEA